MLMQIIEVCLIPLLGILTKYLIDFLAAKSDEIKNKTNNEVAKKYTDMIYETVRNCVIATNQTFVNELKNQGQFNESAQKEAFNKTMIAVQTILGNEAQEYIKSISGDLTAYLTQLIEAEVNKIKGA